MLAQDGDGLGTLPRNVADADKLIVEGYVIRLVTVCHLEGHMSQDTACMHAFAVNLRFVEGVALGFEEARLEVACKQIQEMLTPESGHRTLHMTSRLRKERWRGERNAPRHVNVTVEVSICGRTE